MQRPITQKQLCLGTFYKLFEKGIRIITDVQLKQQVFALCFVDPFFF